MSEYDPKIDELLENRKESAIKPGDVQVRPEQDSESENVRTVNWLSG